MTTATTKLDYNDILAEALRTAADATPERISGCGRVYVCIVDKAHVKGVEKAAKAAGRIFQRKGYAGMRNVLYVGYDNATGKELARGTAMAMVFEAHGISCYRDEQGD